MPPTRDLDPRKAPSALVTVPYVEQTFGAWHIGGGARETRHRRRRTPGTAPRRPAPEHRSGAHHHRRRSGHRRLTGRWRTPTGRSGGRERGCGNRLWPPGRRSGGAATAAGTASCHTVIRRIRAAAGSAGRTENLAHHNVSRTTMTTSSIPCSAPGAALPDPRPTPPFTSAARTTH